MGEMLVKRWNELYKVRLPELAKSRSPVQKKWPVHLDHCFARIILDNAVGQDRPWTEAIKQPAIKHMSDEQFVSAIELAESVIAGDADLDELNSISLQLRGKKRGAGSQASPPSKRIKREDDNISKYFSRTIPSKLLGSVKPSSSGSSNETDAKDLTRSDLSPNNDKDATQQTEKVDMRAQVARIADSKLTAFRKLALALLCQIPPGRYSTYQAMSDFITRSSHKTCARAVGSAMRNNPFAPEVPCHRVLASDRTIGGFCGSWGEDGKFANEKHELLHKEGVRFDSTGKVKGPVFREFTKEALGRVSSEV